MENKIELKPWILDMVIKRLHEIGEPETPTQVAIYVEACVMHVLARVWKRKIKMEKGK